MRVLPRRHWENIGLQVTEKTDAFSPYNNMKRSRQSPGSARKRGRKTEKEWQRKREQPTWMREGGGGGGAGTTFSCAVEEEGGRRRGVGREWHR